MQDGGAGSLVASDFLLLAGNGFLVLVSYPMILIFEQEFLLVSDTTLLELADINQTLLRKLAVEAPGSFQHSLQVANLAEEAARTIGANLHLVRAGALYHDIGKIGNPRYYIENQTDETSPHDKLEPEESAKLIINHVKSGVVLAKNYKIPAPVIDFIRTHHGTTVVYFFYKKYTDQHPEKTGMEKMFTYLGPKPFSKETAVVMMADAVEAASRTIDKFTEESISELVERIIYIQEQDGQYSDVPMTYKDMSDIKSAFKKRLTNMYHARIAYPERSYRISITSSPLYFSGEYLNIPGSEAFLRLKSFTSRVIVMPSLFLYSKLTRSREGFPIVSLTLISSLFSSSGYKSMIYEFFFSSTSLHL
jgi:hypothetical protein